MPFLNARGDVAHGVGGSYCNLNNQRVAFGGVLGWWDDDTIAFCDGNNNWLVSLYNVPTKTTRVLDDAFGGPPGGESANVGFCSNNKHAAWWLGTNVPGRAGIWSTIGVRLPASGLMGMGPDGAIAYKPDYQLTGPTMYRQPDGIEWQLTPGHADSAVLLGINRALWLEAGRPITRNLPLLNTVKGGMWMVHATFCGEWWYSCYHQDYGVFMQPFAQATGFSVQAQGNNWHTMRAIDDHVIRVACSRNIEEQAGQLWVRDYDVVSNHMRDPWGANVWLPAARVPIVNIGAPVVVVPPTYVAPVLDTSGVAFDVWPFFIGAEWPHSSSSTHADTGTLDFLLETCDKQELVRFVKWENGDRYEAFHITSKMIYHWSDNTDPAGATGPYHLTDGRWLASRMKVGDVIDCPFNRIQRYNKQGVLLSDGPMPYVNRIIAKYLAYDFGGDCGVREAFVMEYDPTNGRRGGEYEWMWYAKGWGWAVWQAYNAHTNVMTQEARMVYKGGKRVLPFPLAIPLPPPPPTGVRVLYPNGNEVPVITSPRTHKLVTFVDPSVIDRQYKVEIVNGSIHVEIQSPDGTKLARTGLRRPVMIVS